MRFSPTIITLFLTGAFSSASTVHRRQAQEPACFSACVKQTLASYGGTCAQNDLACLCADSAFVTSTTSCVTSSCTGDDLNNAIAVGLAECGRTSAPISPSASRPASTASTGASSAASATKSSAGHTNGVNAMAGGAALVFVAFL